VRLLNSTALALVFALGGFALASNVHAGSSDVIHEKDPLPGNRVEGGPNPRFDRQNEEAAEVIHKKAPLPGNRVEGGPNPRFDRQAGEPREVIQEKAPLPGNRVEGGPNPRFDRTPK